MKALFMEKTRIAPKKTASDITTLLVEYGARSITFEHGDAGRVSGMSFSLVVNGATLPFRLPLRIDAIFGALNGRRKKLKAESAEKDIEQAERIAWRQLLRWIQAQLAMVDAGMAKTDEVFLPYVLDKSGTSLYEHFAVSGYKMIGPGKEN